MLENPLFLILPKEKYIRFLRVILCFMLSRLEACKQLENSATIANGEPLLIVSDVESM